MTKPESMTQRTARSEVAAHEGMIEIFRAGRHTDMHGRTIEFTADDLKAIAEGYDPELSPAPVVVGHPKTDAPAYGWHKRLVAEGDSLFAEEDQVDEAFNDMRRAGRFKNRSASFYLPDAPNNPKPGQLYIKHVGWLGAAAPAVKGLKQVSFAEDEEGVVEFALSDRRWGFRHVADIARGFRDWLIETAGLEKANEVVPDWRIQALNEAAQDDDSSPAFTAGTGAEETTVTEKKTPAGDKSAEFAEREQQLDTRSADLDTREQKLAERESIARRTDATDFADQLVDQGKVLPKDKATVVELLLALPTDKPLSFADGDDQVEKPAADLFRAFLDGLPKQIEFGERSAETGDGSGSYDFAAPPGAQVDAGQAELHRKARAYQAQHPNTSWLGAVRAVGG